MHCVLSCYEIPFPHSPFFETPRGDVLMSVKFVMRRYVMRRHRGDVSTGGMQQTELHFFI